jgi:predicted phosphodiesterase
VLTDFQGGKVTSSYDLDVMEARVHMAVDKFLSWTRVYRESFKVEDMDLCLLGDQVEGETVFESQVWEIQVPVIDQMIRVARLQAEVIRRLLEEFHEVRVVTAFGNHGRSGKKGGVNHVRSNWDQVSYYMTQELVGPQKGLSWEISEDTFHVHSALGWRICTTHGDIVRGEPATAWSRRIPKMKDVIPGGFDVLIHGHHHHAYSKTVNHTYLCGVGSPESDNTYARDVLAGGTDPSQTCLFVSESHGVVGEHILWLTDRGPQRTER